MGAVVILAGVIPCITPAIIVVMLLVLIIVATVDHEGHTTRHKNPGNRKCSHVVSFNRQSLRAVWGKTLLSMRGASGPYFEICSFIDAVYGVFTP